MRTRLDQHEEIRFHTRRRLLPTAAGGIFMLLCVGAGMLAVAIGPWVALACFAVPSVAWVVFVFAVPPAGGRRCYDVGPAGLVVRAAGEHVAIPWSGIAYVVHRPFAKTADRGTTTIHWDHLELFLHDPHARVSRTVGLGRRQVFGRSRAGAGRRLLIARVHRQGALSKLIVGRCREQIVHRLRTAFDRGREVEYGDFRLDREGVRSPGGFLPWQPGWRIRHYATHEGAGLMITGADGKTIGGWTPERTSAEELIRTLAEEHSGSA